MEIIEVVESLEKSSLLIDGASKMVKHEIKKQEGVCFSAVMAHMAASLICYIWKRSLETEKMTRT